MLAWSHELCFLLYVLLASLFFTFMRCVAVFVRLTNYFLRLNRFERFLSVWEVDKSHQCD